MSDSELLVLRVGVSNWALGAGGPWRGCWLPFSTTPNPKPQIIMTINKKSLAFLDGVPAIHLRSLKFHPHG